jgi:threonine dehydrogenase-like Zn-dependent dehydrogenase
MRALVFTEPSQVVLRDEPAPVAADGEVVITVRAAGICGSELHGFRSVGMRKPPLVMGHEFAGTTPDGRRVTVNPLLSCGDCAACRDGHPQLCATRQLLGVHRAGGFAEQVAVPAASIHVLPDSLGWTEAAVVEPLANGVHAWGLLDAPPQRLAVVGAGAIGLVCYLVAQHNGCSDVVVADPSPQRRAVAASLGARTVKSIADEPAPFDVVIDAVGLPATRATSVSAVRPGGTAVWIGLASADSGFDGNLLVRNEVVVRGSFAYTDAEFAHALELAPQLDLSWATSVPFEQADTTFLELADGRTDLVKAVLRTGDA